MKRRLVTLFAVAAFALMLSPGTRAASAAKDGVIPLIELDNVPLPDAIRRIAALEHLNLLLDPRLSEPPFARLTVSIRWEGVTARDALVALLDNYGLILVETVRHRQ